MKAFLQGVPAQMTPEAQRILSRVQVRAKPSGAITKSLTRQNTAIPQNKRIKLRGGQSIYSELDQIFTEHSLSQKKSAQQVYSIWHIQEKLIKQKHNVAN
jgi:hypothetical protein